MKIARLLFAAAILLAFHANAQSKKEIKKNKVKMLKESHTSVENGKESTFDVSMEKYDDNGNVIEEVDYDKEGKIKSHNTSTYDKNGDKIEEQVLTEDGKLKKKKTFKYN